VHTCRCLFPSFFIVTFISLVKVFNILHPLK
jgi:hypothetical protein